MLAARDANAKKLNPTLRQRLGSQVRVFEVRVAPVDEQIPVGQTRQQIMNHRIDGRPGWNEHHHCAWNTEQCDEFFQTRGSANVTSFRFLAQRFYLAGVLVVTRHGMSVLRHVEQQIAAHNAQTNHAYFISSLRIPIGHKFVSSKSSLARDSGVFQMKPQYRWIAESLAGSNP